MLRFLFAMIFIQAMPSMAGQLPDAVQSFEAVISIPGVIRAKWGKPAGMDINDRMSEFDKLRSEFDRMCGD